MPDEPTNPRRPRRHRRRLDLGCPAIAAQTDAIRVEVAGVRRQVAAIAATIRERFELDD